MYDMKKTKMSAPMAAPNVRVTITSWVPCSLEHRLDGKAGAAIPALGKPLTRIQLPLCTRPATDLAS